jgi:hypothetical protein
VVKREHTESDIESTAEMAAEAEETVEKMDEALDADRAWRLCWLKGSSRRLDG